MDITITLEQRHIDGIYSAYGRPVKTEEQSDKEFAVAKAEFAQQKIIDFIEEHARVEDIKTAEREARAAKTEEIKDLPKPVIKGKSLSDAVAEAAEVAEVAEVAVKK